MQKDIYPCGKVVIELRKMVSGIPFTVSTAHCIMSFAAENGVGIQQRSIRDVIGRFFTRRGLSFYPKHVLESVTQTTQMYINKFQCVLPREYSLRSNHHP